MDGLTRQRGEEMRLAFALTAEERALFFAGADLTQAGPAHWLDVGVSDEAAWVNVLTTVDPEILVTCWSTPPLPPSWIETAGVRLRYICHLTGSVRRLVPRSFLTRGGIVTNWGGIAAPSVAEQALLLALAALRDLGAWGTYMELPPAQRRRDMLRTRPLRGARVGLHGFGGVARHLVSLLRPFDVSIRAYSAGVPERFLREHGVEPCDSLEAAFRESEVVFECEALTPLTRGSVTAAVLRALPDGAVFVNVGRGRVVDEAALAREAASGRIRVAVDVVTNEPVCADDPLCRTPGVIVSPHIGGPTRAEYPLCGQQALDNIVRYRRGEPLTGGVTTEIYDRAT